MPSVDDRHKRARIRSAEAVIRRLNRAATAMAEAVTQEALEVDRMGMNVARSKYSEAEKEIEVAQELVRDCSRSIEEDA